MTRPRLEALTDAELEDEIERRRDQRKKAKLTNGDPYGTWRVTSEGSGGWDLPVEHGVFTGFIDEIARGIRFVGFSLQFEKVPATTVLPAQVSNRSVGVFLLNEGVDFIDKQDRTLFGAALLKDRPVTVGPSDYYGCFTITYPD